MTDQEVQEYIIAKYKKIQSLPKKFRANLELVNKGDNEMFDITDEQIPILIKFLAEHPDINSLILSAEFLRKDGIETLALNNTLKALSLTYPHYISTNAIKTLAINNNLKTLHLHGHPAGGMKIDAEEIRGLADNIILKCLIISNGRINDDSAEILAKNKTLEQLILIGNDIGDKGASALAKNTTLSYLNIGYNHISEKGKEILKSSKIPEVRV